VSGVSRAKFPKSAHLLKHADFRRVYEEGKRHFSGNLTAFYLCRSAEMKAGPVRIGFTVGRALGGSVDRNRIRRRTREAVRFHLEQLAGIAEPVDIVFNPKKSVLKVDFSVLSEEVAKAFQVVRKNVERKSTTPLKPKEGLDGTPVSSL
jgi:ribonuclease P protein component